jgi:hypothetical protein
MIDRQHHAAEGAAERLARAVGIQQRLGAGFKALEAQGLFGNATFGDSQGDDPKGDLQGLRRESLHG